MILLFPESFSSVDMFQIGKDLKVFAYANHLLAWPIVVKIKLQKSQQTQCLIVACCRSGPCPFGFWAPTTVEMSLGNLLQCSIFLTTKKLLLSLNEISMFQFVPTASCPLTGHNWGELHSIVFYFHPSHIYIHGDLLFSRLNGPGFLSLSS